MNTLTTTNKAYIPNTLIETMFMRIATDESMTTYLNYIKQGNTGLATAYASKLVYIKFMKVIK